MTISFRCFQFIFGAKRPSHVFVQSHHVTRMYIHWRGPYSTLTDIATTRYCFVTVSQLWTVTTRVRVTCGVSTDVNFVPHKHVSFCNVSSGASNVPWMGLVRPVHHPCARSWRVSRAVSLCERREPRSRTDDDGPSAFVATVACLHLQHVNIKYG